MKICLTFAAAAAIALGASPALADPGHGHGDKEWKHGGDDDRGYRDGDRSSWRNCPPGLAKKHNGCTPPGQYRQRWSRGERLPRGYNDYTAYNRIPYSYRQRYNLDPNRRYIYRDNMIYQVDPQTQIIQQIIGGLIR